MDFSATPSSKVGFWKRHTTKLPGSALQMDPASWAKDHSTIVDDYDSNYDNNPELSGYQTLPAQDFKEDPEQDATPVSTPIRATAEPSQRSLSTSGSTDQAPSSPKGTSASGTDTLSNVKQEPSFSPSETSSASELPASEATPTSAEGTSGEIEGMKTNARNILQDPLLILRGMDYETAMGDLHLVGTDLKSDQAYSLQRSKQKDRFSKFKIMLQSPVVDLDVLRKLSWSGVPTAIRPIVWQLLVGYLPCNSDRRNVALERKRKEYQDGVQQTFARGIEGLDQTIWHQVFIDVPRTNPKMALFQNQTTQRCLERILYCWAIRHPASSYVQGINDLVTPFFLVFLTAYIEEDQDPESYNISLLPPEILAAIEADSYWCLSKLLDGIQDNYTHAQPGIQRQIVKLRELICRIDAPLAAHLQSEHVEFIQFSFRWMNCLLMREVTLQHTIRMWDTYLTEHPHGFSEFHLYVCAAFLTKWSAELKRMEFQEIMLFLQDVPTDDWQEKDIELLLSEAFMWKSLFHASPMHLGGSK
ncbi:GTPase-activating protein [Haplosporangium sp. Z 11]|nr:GTPase-activating protein [Haplosporangium sp. Z 11]